MRPKTILPSSSRSSATGTTPLPVSMRITPSCSGAASTNARAERRMPGERKLVPRREDPDANVGLAFRRKHEDRLREADLERDPLHRVVVEPSGVGEHGELVAGQRHVREDVREDEPVRRQGRTSSSPIWIPRSSSSISKRPGIVAWNTIRAFCPGATSADRS